MTNAPTEIEALAIHGGEPYNISTKNAEDVVTPGGAVCNTLAPTRRGQKLPAIKNSNDTWYKRDPQRFLGGVQGMGPELIGAYAVILDVLYARHGDMPRDDRHLSGVLGCSIRKARALTEQLIDLEKIKIVDGKIVNRKASEVIGEREKQRETGVKPTRSNNENATTSNEINDLNLQRREEKNTPLTPRGGPRRKSGVPENVIKLLGVGS